MLTLNFRVTDSGVPILSKEDIENHATNFLYGYDKSLLMKPQPIPIEEIIENHLGLQIDYKDLSKDNAILGLTAFTDGWLKVYNPEKDHEEPIKVMKGTIIIDNHLVNDDALERRLRFTFSHEISHWLLHKKKYEKNENQIVFFQATDEIETIKCLSRNVEDIFKFSKSNLKTDDDWLEWQADFMGGALLLPRKPFLQKFSVLLDKLRLHHGYLYYDNQPCNKSNYNTVTSEMSQTFNVSKKAVHVRLVKLNLLKTSQKQESFLSE